jgi:hypothetical protein
MPKRVAAFGEDFAHKEVVGALIERLADGVGVAVEIDWRSARGGHGRVVAELREYLRDLRRSAYLPDLVLIATDANCKGAARRGEIPTDQSPVPAVLAIPDPHIERWLLVDGEAFKHVLGRGCQAPDQKCARDRYKHALIHAIADAGVTPSLGGIEFAQDIIAAMDLHRAAQADVELERFLDDLRHALKGDSA